jgi:N-acetylglutamate synthase-like GNAT family acetyltransferase
MFKLRPATEHDSGTIRHLVHLGQINPIGLDWRRFILAEGETGEVIGCGQIKPHRDGSHELASIVVHPDWRGRGVARAIIERLLRAHPGELYLTCRAEMEPMYQKFGFHTLKLEAMPPYFQRISRLVSLLLRSQGSRLLVMKRDGDA